MATPFQPHSGTWVAFTYASFFGSVAMVSLGILFLPVPLSLRAYMAMGMLMLLQSCVILTKTLRDQHESGKLINRLDEVRTEEMIVKTIRG